MNIPRLAMRTLPLLALALAAALLVALSVENRELRSQYSELFRQSVDPHPGLPVPIFSARTVEGAEVVVGAPGEDVRQLLFFFTTTCRYCQASLPALKRIASALEEDSGAELYGVALDSLPLVRHYVEEYELNFPVAVLRDRRTAALYRIRAVPQLIAVGGDGRVIYSRTGVLEDAAATDSVIAAVRSAGMAATGALGAAERGD